MTRDEFFVLLEPLVLAMRAEFDQPTWGAYYSALHDVPATVFAATVHAAMREPLEFFPKAGELRGKAERQRRMLLALRPHEACCECEDSKGWCRTMRDGQLIAERCPCVARHQVQLQALGLLTPIATLPTEDGAGDEAAYPTVDQLPAEHRQRLHAIAAGKAMVH